MKFVLKKFACVLYSLFFFSVIVSCAPSSSLQKKYGDDYYYFIALQKIRQGNESEAISFLNKAIKKSSPLLARKALEKKCSLGSVSEKLKTCEKLYTRFNDNASLTTYCNELLKYNEYSKIIELTKNVSYESESDFSNELLYERLVSLYKKNDSSFSRDFFKWSTQKTFSSYHILLCSQIEIPENCIELIDFRTNIYNRNYLKAFDSVKNILENTQYISPQILSEAGKALLYGSKNYYENALYLEKLNVSEEDKDCSFYKEFYTGRLYSKCNSYPTKTTNAFIRAMNSSSSKEKYDNALWYYLNEVQKKSIKDTFTAIERFKSKWNNSAYFDDIFNTLCVTLLNEHKYKDFYLITKSIKGFCSEETYSKFAYITARLIQLQFLTERNFEEDIDLDEVAASLLEDCLSPSSALYYKLLAAYNLQYSDEKIYELICKKNYDKSGSGESIPFAPDFSQENYLLGLADFGFAEILYDEWKKTPSSSISLETATKLSSFLNKCGQENNNYYSQSLRIASKKFYAMETDSSAKFLNLVFPNCFKDDIESMCREFNTPPYLFYALVRSESFFDTQIESHAGAVGLTQLMSSTASDVAKKLKVSEYDLKDYKTNLRFGCYYLEELRRRLDSQSLLALFAYNAGPSRVRAWVKSAKIEFGKNDLPQDLFLEALPYEETREYGRKVLSAACLYGALYYSKSFSEVIEEIIQLR